MKPCVYYTLFIWGVGMSGHPEKKKDFGNARGIRNLVDELKKKRDARIIAIVDQKNVSLSPEEIKTIKVEDINQLIHAKE